MPENTVIAIVNEKGGTGKTTTSVSLAAALGEMGRNVLLVDLDGQAASSRWVGVEDDHRLADALRAGGGLQPIPNVLPNVSLAPASGKLDSVSHDLRPTQGGQLRKVLGELQGFDFVLIDCPPSLGNRLIGNALLAATHVIVPVETSILALDGLKILLTTLEDVRDGFGHQIVLGGVLACRYDGRTRLSQLVLTELRRALPGKVFNTVIRENVRMRECPASGQSILGFASDSHAADDYRSLAKELIDEPDKWRLPAACQIGLAAGQSGFSVEGLRDQTAARLREATRKPQGSGKAASRNETSPQPPAWDELPQPSDADDVAMMTPLEPATPAELTAPRPAAPSEPPVPAWWLVDGSSGAVAVAASSQPATPELPKAAAAGEAEDETCVGETVNDSVHALESWLDGIEKAQGSIEDDGVIVLNDEPLPLPAAPAATASKVPAAADAVTSPGAMLAPVESQATLPEQAVAAKDSPSIPDVRADVSEVQVPIGEEKSPVVHVAAQPGAPAEAVKPLAGEQSLGLLSFSSLPPKSGHAAPAPQNEPHERKGGLDGSSGQEFPALREMVKKMTGGKSQDALATQAAVEARNAKRPAWRRLFDRTPSEK